MITGAAPPGAFGSLAPACGEALPLCPLYRIIHDSALVPFPRDHEFGGHRLRVVLLEISTRDKRDNVDPMRSESVLYIIV